MRLGHLGWAALLGPLVPTLSLAQEETPSLAWSAVVYYDAQQIAPSPDRAFWHTVTAGVQRYLPNGSVALQAIATRRFDLEDQALALDVYHDLWPGAYGNGVVRFASDAETIPQYHIGLELFQTIAAMEISASYQHQEFAIADVNTFGLGTVHYVGAWYLRPRGLVANIDETWSPFFAFTARRYLGDSTDHFFDFSIGGGEEVLEVAAPPATAAPVSVITSGSRFGSLRIQRFLSPHLGGFVGGSYSAYDEIPDRWGISIGAITRW